MAVVAFTDDLWAGAVDLRHTTAESQSFDPDERAAPAEIRRQIEQQLADPSSAPNTS